MSVGTVARTRLQPLARRGGVTLLGRRSGPLLVGAGALVVGGMAAQYKPVARAVLGLSMMLVFALVATTNRRLALVLAVTGLIMLGFVRRLLIPFAGWNPSDPLLLVSPACAILLWLQGARGKALPRSAMASLALVLMLWAGAEILNPSELSLVVGLQAALFWITPFLWFFAGRTLDADEHDALLRTVFWVGIVVIAHGMYQTFVGLLPFEYTWLDYSGPGASIFLEGFKIRPFSTLVSPQEYGFFLGLLACVILSRLLHGKRNLLVGAYFLVAATALFLQGTRQVLALCVLAASTMVVLRLRSAGSRLVVVSSAVFVMFALIPMLFEPGPEPMPAAESSTSGSTASLLASHQVSGFSDPMNSTLPLHLELIVDGFEASFSHPFGVGIGEASMVAGREGRGINTENDVASVFAALGVGGGILYVAFIGISVLSALVLYLRRRNAMHLAWAGMAVVHLTQWWSGTLYATTSILFLILGGVAAATRDRSEAPAPERAPART